MTLSTILIICATLTFLVLERVFPGWKLPHVSGWYFRAALINLAQLGITLGTGQLWIKYFGDASLVPFSSLEFPLAEGFIGWFIGTFVFY